MVVPTFDIDLFSRAEGFHASLPPSRSTGNMRNGNEWRQAVRQATRRSKEEEGPKMDIREKVLERVERTGWLCSLRMIVSHKPSTLLQRNLPEDARSRVARCVAR